jgi:hypothetical protein
MYIQVARILVEPGFKEYRYRNKMDKELYIQHAERLCEIAKQTGEPIEGNLYTHHLRYEVYPPAETRRTNLSVLSRNSKNILEIGFNAGHSCLVFLLSNPSSKIYLFDVCTHLYAVPCFEYLQSVFGKDRLELIQGYSEQTIPEFRQRKIPIDLYHIDGAHDTVSVSTDIDNCSRIAIENGTTTGLPAIVIVDDTNMPHILDVWKQTVLDEKISPYKCDGLVQPVDCLHEIGTFNTDSAVTIDYNPISFYKEDYTDVMSFGLSPVISEIISECRVESDCRLSSEMFPMFPDYITPGTIAECLGSGFELYNRVCPDPGPEYKDSQLANLSIDRSNRNIYGAKVEDSAATRSRLFNYKLRTAKGLLFVYGDDTSLRSGDVRSGEFDRSNSTVNNSNLQKCSEILRSLYPKLQFKILAFHINREFPSTENIINIRVNIDERNFGSVSISKQYKQALKSYICKLFSPSPTTHALISNIGFDVGSTTLRVEQNDAIGTLFKGGFFPNDKEYVKLCMNFDYYMSLEPTIKLPNTESDWFRSNGNKPWFKHVDVRKPYTVLYIGDIELHCVDGQEQDSIISRYKERRDNFRNKRLLPIFLFSDAQLFQDHPYKEYKELVSDFTSIPTALYLTGESGNNSNTRLRHVPEWKEGLRPREYHGVRLEADSVVPFYRNRFEGTLSVLDLKTYSKERKI